jgi:hypothetical protein
MGVWLIGEGNLVKHESDDIVYSLVFPIIYIL